MSQTRNSRLYCICFLIICIFFAGIPSFAQPTIVSIAPATVCQGDSITITGTGFTGANAVTIGTQTASGFNVKDDKTILAKVGDLAKSGDVTVTTPKGASNKISITINETPDPDLGDVSANVDLPFTNCDGSTSYVLKVVNKTENQQSNCTYDIDWGDGSTHFNQTDWAANGTTTHTYTSQGYFKIVFKITTSKGCSKTKIISFYNGVNPLASFTTTSSTTFLCTPAAVNFKIGNWFNNSPGTTYQIDFGDGSPLVILKHPLNNADTDEVVTHTYTKSSCPGQVDYTATLKAINACFITTYTLDQILIRQKPKADFSWLPDTGCVSEPVCFTNKTTDGYSGTSCSPIADYLWDFGDGSTSTNENPGCHQYAKAGTYTVKLSASNNACGSDAISKKVVVVPTSEKPTANPVTYCVGETAVPLTATGSNLLWYTTATGGPGSSTAPTPSTLFPGTTTYYVSQTKKDQCESQRIPVTVTVYALPGAPEVTSPVQLCKGKTTGPLTATGKNLLWYTSSSGGTGSSTAPIPNTNNVGTVFYYVSQTTNGCEGPRAAIEVEVSDIPAIPVVATPVTYCQNQKAGPLTASGTGLLWYTSASGGTASSMAPTPVTSTPGTTYYYVSASNYCGESGRAKIEVDVLAGPSATIGYSKNILCNSTDGSPDPNPPLQPTITGSKGGTFSISPSGMPIDASTGTITPSGANAGTYTIKYYIKSGGGCSDFSTTTTIIVTDKPSATIQYNPICSSDEQALVNIAGTKGGTFSSASGLIIDAATGTISPAVSTPGNYVVTYTIAASSPCPGFTTTTNITISKAPDASISYGVTNLCNVKDDASTPNPPLKIKLTGTKGGTYNIAPNTGLKMDADGTIYPSEAQPGNYTITYTIAASGGCKVFSAKTTVAVSSSPVATIQYPAICSSNGPVVVLIDGVQGGQFSSTAGLDIDPTTGTITPANSKAGKYTITYTIAAAAPCPGFTTTTSVVITAAPNATIDYGKANLCNVENINNSNPDVAVILTGTKGGIFSISPSSGLPISANTGTLTPSKATPGNYTITYTVKAGGGCDAYTTNTAIVIDKTPEAIITYPGAPFCTGTNSLQTVSLSGTQGGTFSSTTGLSLDANTGDINPSLSKPGTYKIKYSIAPSAPCPGFDTSTNITIIESPSISFDKTSQSVCSATPAVFIPISTVATTVYNWSVKGGLPQDISGVSSGTTSGPDAAIHLLFTNTGTASETLTIVVTPVNPAGNSCAGAPYELSLTINPVPSALKGDTTTFCMHAPSMALTAQPDAGNTVKWYDENNILLPDAPLINTKYPASFQYFATQTNVYGCESPASIFVAIVHPVAKIISSSYLSPTLCGLPSGSVTLQVVDLNGDPMPDMPVKVHYTKFLVEYNVSDSTDATGKIIIPLTAGTYSDFYVETFGCLSQKLPDIFELKDPTPPAQPIAGYNAPICSESVLNLSASSPTSSQTGTIYYVWAGPAFGNEPDTSQNTVVSFPSAKTSYNGLYIVYAIQNNCISDPSSFPVEIKQSPTKPVITTRTPLCIGDNLSLVATSSITGNNTLNYVWNGPGTGFPVNGAYAGISPVKIEDGGVYSITVTSPETGCSATADTLVQVGGYPVVKFGKDSFNLPTGYIMKLSPDIVNASDKNILPITKYEWAPAENIQCNDAPCSLPVITVKKDICYTVKATNLYGCSGSDTVCISTFCTNAQVFVPNAFTPRGLAANSKFMVRASGIASVKSFRVFNRWGRIVFEKNNFAPNDPAYGWDGYVNGKLADMGVYVYTVEVVCDNGTPYTYKGNVTLLQ